MLTENEGGRGSANMEVVVAKVVVAHAVVVATSVVASYPPLPSTLEPR